MSLCIDSFKRQEIMSGNYMGEKALLIKCIVILLIIKQLPNKIKREFALL